jgi:hypothetical protein
MEMHNKSSYSGISVVYFLIEKRQLFAAYSTNTYHDNCLCINCSRKRLCISTYHDIT